MLLHKQQSVDGQLLYRMVSSRLKTSTIPSLIWHVLKKMLLLSRTRNSHRRYAAECLKLSYGINNTSCLWCFGLQQSSACWVPRNHTISACKLLVVMSTCTWQILSSYFIDMWPWMRPVFTILTWNETTRYAVEAHNLTSSGQVSENHIGHKVMASETEFWRLTTCNKAKMPLVYITPD